jgi:branched-chain amino acid transport system permease protein
VNPLRISAKPAWLALALLLLILLPAVASDYYIAFGAKVMIMAIFALSLDLLVGHTGLVSLGHAAYFGVAGYVLAAMSPQYAAANLLITLPCALLAAALVALAVGFMVLRTSGVYFIMVTLAFAQMLYYLFHDTAPGGSDGVYLNLRPEISLAGWVPFSLESKAGFYFFTFALLLVCLLLLRLLLRSPFGRALHGIRVNEQRMRSLGYATFRYKLAAFVCAGTLAGLAGYLYAMQFGFVNPELLSWHQSGNVLMMVILGGLGSLSGPVIGALVFTLLQEVFEAWTKHWQLLMGGFIVLVVLFVPGGLRGLAARLLGRTEKTRTAAAEAGQEHD